MCSQYNLCWISKDEAWRELTNHRMNEAVISYSECHDQNIQGNKTLISRLLDYRGINE